MKNWLLTLLAGSLALATLTLPAVAQTATTNLLVGVVAESTLTVGAADTPLSKTDLTFGNFTGTTTLTYKVRIAKSGSTGKITATFEEFDVPTGGVGPKVASDLTLACKPTLGTPSPVGALSVGPNINIIDFVANTRGSGTGTVNWTLVDNPLFETGNYKSKVTFTMSTT
ncbi:MAG: hypothetical protein IPP47_05375 [Bryobacterales bacterium]|nr:hypothetical protein [Bryobacterales bacterium]